MDGFPYYNTSLSGKGDKYPDPHSRYLAGENSYLLLTVKRGGPMIVEIKSLKNTVLESGKNSNDEASKYPHDEPPRNQRYALALYDQ